jgi:hypothetical protein
MATAEAQRQKVFIYSLRLSVFAVFAESLSSVQVFEATKAS